MFNHIVTVKTLIRVAFTALSLANIGVAHSQPIPAGSALAVFETISR
nr:hypothetical protein [uncultured Rhodopila sp.]